MIQLSRSDQIKLLHATADKIVELIEYMDKVEFDEDIISYANDLSRVTDTVDDACIYLLHTDEDIVEMENERREERQYTEHVRQIYYRGLL